MKDTTIQGISRALESKTEECNKLEVQVRNNENIITELKSKLRKIGDTFKDVNN